VASSTVQWNGANRATTFVSAAQLQASISSSDVASSGTVQVAVSTPAPGGGTSAPVIFTIAAGPTLTVSATTVASGTPVTVTLANGFGGALDWIGLAATGSPDMTYVQWTYVGTGVTATSAAAGTSVTVTLTGGAGGSSDWLALAATGAPNTSYLQWTYVGTGVTTRTWTVTVPATAGTYEFRYFLGGGYSLAATSPS